MRRGTEGPRKDTDDRVGRGGDPVPNVRLHDYQEYSKDLILHKSGVGLFLDMGFGKTLTCLQALYEMNPACHTLVVAPKTVAATTWPAEVEKWGYPFRTLSLVVDGRGRTLPGKKTLELVDGLAAEPSTLCFLNKERLASVVAHVMDDPACPFIGTWPFPVVILDELQAFKSSSSKLFGAMARVRPQVAKIVGLTGTPSPQGLTDLWPELYLLDGGRSLGTSEDTFLTTFFAPHDYDPGRGKKKIRFWDPLPGAHGAVMARIADTCVSVANPNISLPEVTVNDITVAMDAKERDLYDDLFYNWTLTLGVDGQGRPVEVDVVSKTVLSNKLRQMASGALYLGDGREYVPIHERKLDALGQVFEASTAPVLVCYHFRSDLDMICRRFGVAGDGTRKDTAVEVFDGTAAMLSRWNRGEIGRLLIQPQSAGHGLNFQEGGHTMVWYTLPWALEVYMQANARLARQGQRHPVIIHRILCADTVDQRVAGALAGKREVQDSVLRDVARDVLGRRSRDG